MSVVSYLLANADITRSGIMDAMLAKFVENTDLLNKYQIKRLGKDKDNIQWLFSKIHSLENIAFVDDATLETIGLNPVSL